MSVDIRWAIVNTHGFIRVPLGMLRAPIPTPEGELLMPIEATPHYPWIKSLVAGRDDVHLRDKYREHWAAYHHRDDTQARLEQVEALVESFKTRADHDSLITIVTHAPTRYQGSDYIVIYDGVHRSAIATALGHEFVRCRLASNRIYSRDFGRRICLQAVPGPCR